MIFFLKYPKFHFTNNSQWEKLAHFQMNITLKIENLWKETHTLSNIQQVHMATYQTKQKMK